MPLVPITHRAVTAQAIQFDGTIPSLLTIFGVRPQDHPNMQVTMQLDAAASVASVYLGANGGGALTFGPGDWVVFPDDTSQSAFVLGDADYQRDWSMS